MKLADLEPHFLKILDDKSYLYLGVSREEADGVQFLCPVCFKKNGGSVGTHMIICWGEHVSQDHYPKPGRWILVGELENLTLNASGARSVLLTSGCNAHFHVTNGEIQPC